ncbi:MAG: PQQ-dependent sugar dehydrogenase [Chloroflexi bacterium]|nr:PQQ-dependent sugar dehydrogenase [Chloroflexota bacterium]
MLRYLTLLTPLLLLVACGGNPTAEPSAPLATAEATAVPETAANIMAGTTSTPAPTAVPLPTSTPLPPPATATAVPTATPDPLRLIPHTPPAGQSEPFVPYGAVEQPPYAESSCSDKYPCNEDTAAWEARIRVPAGFSAGYFAYLDGQQPTAMDFGPDGQLYVATQGGNIFTVNEAGEATLFFEGLTAPTGITFRPGTNQLYISSRVVEDNANGEANISVLEDGVLTPLITGLPCCYAFMHGPHTIVFDTEGWGYVGVGAKADHGEILGTNDRAELQPYEAGILRFSPDGRTVEKYAEGLRNPYGIAIDANNQLYANDNGPDFGPPDEFHVIVPGAHHGYPYYDCPVCFTAPAGLELVPTAFEYAPHASPTGMVAYLESQFPNAYNNTFSVLWSAFPEAQRVVRHGPNGEGAETFATGFAAPIAVTVGPDGSLYVADWATGIVFRIEYGGE